MNSIFVLFRVSGAAAVFFLLTAAASGFWGSTLRRVLAPGRVLQLHKGLGLAGVLAGLVHGLIYWIFLK